jgi:hypothetical protein
MAPDEANRIIQAVSGVLERTERRVLDELGGLKVQVARVETRQEAFENACPLRHELVQQQFDAVDGEVTSIKAALGEVRQNHNEAAKAAAADLKGQVAVRTAQLHDWHKYAICTLGGGFVTGVFVVAWELFKWKAGMK